MRLRLRLALIFLLLSALPLTLLAVWSYLRSSGALRRAIEAEAQLMARDLERRVGEVATDVDRRVRELAHLPRSFWLTADGATAGDADAKVLTGFAEALPFIENFRFVPSPATASGGASTSAAAPTAASGYSFRFEPQQAAKAKPKGARATGATPEPTPPSPEGEELISEEEIDKAMLSAMESVKMAHANPPPNMPPEEFAKLAAELERVRIEVGRSIELRNEVREERRVARQEEKRAEMAARRFGGEAAAPPPPPAPAPAAPAAPAVSAAPVVAPAPAAAPAPSPAPGKDLSFAVRDNGEVVGEITGKLKAKEILRSVLGRTEREQGEIPFAVDDENELYVSNDDDGRQLRELPAVAALQGVKGDAAVDRDNQWIVVAQRDEASGLRFGIARPVSQAMRDLKTHTALNFAAAFFLIGVATVGMIPLTGGLVKNVHALEAGAARIAQGDLTTRVRIGSRDEFGRLAASFNRMAAQLSEHQEKLLEQERIGKEREIERRLLEAENDRKSQELEDARRFQLSLLPRKLPERPGLELGVAMSTATEVGGDYYDFRDDADGSLRVAVGDATGHGAAAGTMVTVVKSLFMAGVAAESPEAFLRRATGLVHGMGLSRMAMALTVLRCAGRRVTISSAGMPPALHFRAASGEVDEIALPGMPLGARADFAYLERELELATGDSLLLMSDGFPELPGAGGEPMGYERARAAFAAAAPGSASDAVAALERAAADWAGGSSPGDDITFLVLRAV